MVSRQESHCQLQRWHILDWVWRLVRVLPMPPAYKGDFRRHEGVLERISALEKVLHTVEALFCVAARQVKCPLTVDIFRKLCTSVTI